MQSLKCIPHYAACRCEYKGAGIYQEDSLLNCCPIKESESLRAVDENRTMWAIRRLTEAFVKCVVILECKTTRANDSNEATT